jgi:hypothetical protein
MGSSSRKNAVLLASMFLVFGAMSATSVAWANDLNVLNGGHGNGYSRNANAKINPILSANREVGLFFSETQSNYSENIKSRYGSDVEHGMMPGFGIKASDNFNIAGINNLYASISYRRTSGQTQYSDGSAYVSAGHNSNNINAKFGKTFFVSNGMAVTPYIFGGYRSWGRVVPGGVANPEHYTNEYVGLGGMFQYAPSKKLVLSVNTGIAEVVGGHINANTQGLYRMTGGYLFPSSMSQSLASRPYYTLGVGADYRVDKHLHLFSNLQYTDFMYGGSKTQTYYGSGPLKGYYGTLREPSSQTSNLNAEIGVAYSWD